MGLGKHLFDDDICLPVCFVIYFKLSSYLLFDLICYFDLSVVLQTKPADRGEQAGIHDAVQPALQATIPGIYRKLFLAFTRNSFVLSLPNALTRFFISLNSCF
jgi:hypothetical protein